MDCGFNEDLIRITRPSLTTTQLLGTADHSYLKSGSVTTLAREEGGVERLL